MMTGMMMMENMGRYVCDLAWMAKGTYHNHDNHGDGDLFSNI